MSFLILRPVAKYQSSVAAFTTANLSAVGVGLIDTLADQKAVSELPAMIAALAPHSLVIFISTTAAELACQQQITWPPATLVMAVGQATASKLENAGLVPLVPTIPNTEGLLALAELQTVTGREVLIVKGQGGRPDLAEQLCARGAQVREANLYQRLKLNSPQATQLWHATQIQCIIATSGELIEAAFDQFEANWLQSVPWIVVSERTQLIAAKLGVNQILLSEDASDQALIHCAKEFLER